MIKQGNLVIPSIFAVTPLLRGNSDAINKSNVRNFSAYIINNETLTGLQQCSNRKTKSVPYGSFNLHEIYTQCSICSLYFIGTDADPHSTLLNIWSNLLFNISSLLIINLRANPKHGSILFVICLNSVFVLQFW